MDFFGVLLGNEEVLGDLVEEAVFEVEGDSEEVAVDVCPLEAEGEGETDPVRVVEAERVDDAGIELEGEADWEGVIDRVVDAEMETEGEGETDPVRVVEAVGVLDAGIELEGEGDCEGLLDAGMEAEGLIDAEVEAGIEFEAEGDWEGLLDAGIEFEGEELLDAGIEDEGEGD